MERNFEKLLHGAFNDIWFMQSNTPTLSRNIAGRTVVEITSKCRP
jgi:hypothetical protein